MSDSLKKLNLEVALLEWPSFDDPEADWEAKARVIDEELRLERIAHAQSSVEDDDLWAAPFPTSSSSPSSASPMGEDNSGIVDLAALSKEEAGGRTQSSDRGDPRAPHAPPIAAAAREDAQKRSGGAAVIALVVALSAAAAGAVLFMTPKEPRAPSAAATNVPAPETAAPIEPAPSPATTMAAAPTSTSAPAKIEPEAAPAPSAKLALAPKAAAKAPAAPAKPEVLAKADPESESPKSEDVEPAPHAAAPSGSLGREIEEHAPREPLPRPAAATTGEKMPSGSVPQRPSQGAVAGALGVVLPSARECLGPEEASARASIVFGSDGSVRSVTVSGEAAGKPAESCIKGALSKATVPPFAEPSFLAAVTIRPK